MEHRSFFFPTAFFDWQMMWRLSYRCSSPLCERDFNPPAYVVGLYCWRQRWTHTQTKNKRKKNKSKRQASYMTRCLSDSRFTSAPFFFKHVLFTWFYSHFCFPCCKSEGAFSAILSRFFFFESFLFFF